MDQIPKIIHYCWFGGNPLPKSAIKCINSWKKYCPDYEIKEWNENNFDLECCDYVKEAASVGKWAFVSDYARFKILYENGGLYFDTDVEMIKSFNKIILQGNFLGVELPLDVFKSSKYLINPGLGMGCRPGDVIVLDILNLYKNEHYIIEDGIFNKKTILNYTTNIFENYGYNSKNIIQKVGDWTIYPTDFFCPMNYSTGEICITNNTRSIHHYSMSWKTPYEIFMKQWERLFRKQFGKKIGWFLYRGTSLPIRIIHKFYTVIKRGSR